MARKNTYRLEISFIAAIIYLFRANPTLWSIVTGAILMGVGEAIRFASAGTITKYKAVACTGIYSCSRNPLYVGSFIIGSGACIMGRDPWFAAFFIIAFPLMYYRIIRREEGFLADRYGEEYINYKKTVPRLWSGKLPLGDIIRSYSHPLAMKNKEYEALMGVVAVIIFMAVKLYFF